MQADEMISGEIDIEETQKGTNDLPYLEEKDENAHNTFKQLLTTSVFPWSIFNKRVPYCINRTLLKLGNLVQVMLLVLWISYGLYLQFFIVTSIPKFYSPVYLKTGENCSRYYLFNVTTFEHYIVDLNEGKELNDDLANAKCLHLPFFVLGAVANWLLHCLMGVGWGYTIDRRYGFLKIVHENIVDRLRQMHIMLQLPVILILIPFNVIAATMITVIGIRLVPLMAILTFVFKSIIELAPTSNIVGCSSKRSIDKFSCKFFQDTNLSSMYLFFTLLDTLGALIWLFTLTIGGFNGNDYPFILESFRKTRYVRLAYLIYRTLQIYKAKAHFWRFCAALRTAVPFLTSIWTLVDVILDIIQTCKYKLLSCGKTNAKISPLFFVFSVVSFISPVILCFIALLIENKERIFYTKSRSSCNNKWIPIFCHILKIIVLLLFYLVISVIMYYVILPIIIVKSALDNIRKGDDDERQSDWDPFQLVSQNSKYMGILDVLGFGCVQSRHIPLLAGTEQLGEALIQTILSAVFIFQNHENSWFQEYDELLGLQFPTSIVSLIFSIVSVLIAVIRLVIIAVKNYQSTRK